MKLYLNINKENKDTINSPTVIAELFDKKFVNFATTVESPKFQKIVNNDDNMFAFPTNLTEVFNTVGYLKNNKAARTHGVSTEVPKTSLPVIISILIEFLNLSSSRGWFLKYLMDAKVYPLHKSGDIMNIIKYRSVSIISAISKVFEKIMYERIYPFFDKENKFYRNSLDFLVSQALLMLLLKLQTKNGKSLLIHLHLYCLICVNQLIPSIRKFFLAKLEKYGVRGICLEWFKPY